MLAATFVAAAVVIAQVPATGAITGRIVDHEGAPVAQAQVRALQAEYRPGGRRLRARAGAVTDAKGDYRLAELPPGKYLVTRATRPLAPTFYPGTATATDGLPVVVRAGQDTVAVDFSLTHVPLARSSGFVRTADGKPAAGHLLLLNAARRDGVWIAPVSGDAMLQADADGSFAFAKVAPGDYRIDVISHTALEHITKAGRSGIPQNVEGVEYASVPVRVVGEDIAALTIVTRPGSRLRGRLLIEGAAASPEVLRRITVSSYDPRFANSPSSALFGAHADVQEDGAFETRGLSGTCIPRSFNLPGGWALKAVRHAGLDVTDAGIDVGRRTSTMWISRLPQRRRASRAW